MKYTWDIVGRLTIVAIVSAAVALVLGRPGQVIELYLIDAEAIFKYDERFISLSLENFASLLSPALTFSILSVILWLGSIHLLSLDPTLETASRKHQIAGSLLVGAVASGPSLGLLAGMRAAHEIATKIDRRANGLEATLDFAVLFAAVALALTFVTSSAATYSLFRRLANVAQRVFAGRNSIIAATLILMCMTSIAVYPTLLPIRIGTLTTVFSFFSLICWALVFSASLYKRSGYPAATIAVALGVLFSLMGWNNNHKVEHQDVEQPAWLEESFSAWLKQRNDRAHFEALQKPYPVYVISAEGGGLYAAYHLAAFLARMQDLCPMFAQHIFAISSVSGGSLGAAHFVAQVEKQVPNSSWEPCRPMTSQGQFSEAAARFFSNDFLSPLVAATLFPDFVQRFLPFPVFPFDRARGLERSFFDAWATAGNDEHSSNPFGRTLNDLWSSAGSAPALFLNTTNIETGARVTLSPIMFRTTPTATHVSEAMCSKNPRPVTMSLGSAVSLSARFPWITPAGWLERDEELTARCSDRAATSPRSRDRLYLADGGYFENSGLETAGEIVKRLRHFVSLCEKPANLTQKDGICGARTGPVEIRTIMIFSMDSFFRRMLGFDSELSSSSSSEVYAPLQALLNTRSTRTHATQLREWIFDENLNTREPSSFYEIPDSPLQYGTRDFYQVMLNGVDDFLPLGWRLSRRSISKIAENADGSRRLTEELIQRELMGKSVDDLHGR